MKSVTNSFKITTLIIFKELKQNIYLGNILKVLFR